MTEATVVNVLTRTTGYLREVTTHSLQPYRGCSYGNSLCGVGCYVQHNGHVVRGRKWGSFLEVRVNAADSYLEHVHRERSWARKSRGTFSIFCSSSTDPFVPQERRARVTSRVLEAMLAEPPDELVIQTHSHLVSEEVERLRELSRRCRLRVHVSIETDRESIPGLPPHASPIEKRFEACCALKGAGIETVVTVAPLLPIENPRRFFSRIAEAADAVVLDHFIGGDGSAGGIRTFRTPLPGAIANVDPSATELSYRDAMAAIALKCVTRVGIGIDGFAARFLRCENT
jgi:DNA repair photolyase